MKFRGMKGLANFYQSVCLTIFIVSFATKKRNTMILFAILAGLAMPKPKINFVPFTDDELDKLSEITEQDILDTHQTIVTAVSDRFKNLVLADRVQLFGDENVNS